MQTCGDALTAYLEREGVKLAEYEGIWGALENKVAQVAKKADNSRLIVFAGPVLDDDDDEYTWGVGYIKIPMKYWKVVIASETGRLQAYGFVLDQTQAFKDLGFERLRFGKFEEKRETLAEIMQMTGVTFPQVVVDAEAAM